ncbi:MULTISPECIES: ABC transporter ATP-binding protein [Cyanophyceae]|uniref:ABC transporter ATP-binding protein n=1 Tax=Cyanophyceae TaxID=3028117 RepID=UPI0016843F27|nr:MULTISPECIES: ABC transporter ATP-binding protein [Cyanophyceae]MBD1916413.1 ABC transporter ATP-binding protein [Phormidium sp. FACHB-77]MBD2032705.1 ABC transporter ATP-binding protein [Phormidium sp. FACHB-322]MBD2050077.1 ABC transporter ATP-binding protein [Leptolyngbya sp. FACHB-60]
MAAAVTIQNLKKSYGAVEAVRDVSLTIEPGEIFGLLGPNGAGKTTTIRCLCTLATPDSGTLEVMGVSVVEQPRLVRQYLGYIAQEVALDKVLTGRELLRLQADIYHMPRGVSGPRINQMIDLLELGDWADKKTGTYSGGLRKRLDLALGLLHQPDLLVLDEPTVGLDIETRSAVWGFLRQLRAAGTTILVTSHYLEEVDALADRVAIIDRGRVISAGTPSDLKDKIGGDRITLRIREFTSDAEAADARTMLAELPFVREVIVNSAQGNSLNLVVDRQPDVLLTVQQALKAADLPVFGIAQSRPSLDDVYLAATGRTLMDAELAAVGQRDLKKEKKQAMKGR